MDKLDISYRSPLKITNELLWASVRQAAKTYGKGKLIDLGCGTKPYEKLFMPYVSQYFGVDWQGTSEFHYGYATKADLYADCTNTGLEAGSFDTLLSTQVIEHIYDTHAYLQECHRLLKKEGVAIFTVPLTWETHAEPFDYYRFTRFSLEKLFVQHGFVVEEIEPIGGAYATLTQLKIISLYYRPVDSFIYRVLRRIKNELFIPLQNFLALHLDRVFWNDKLCLNYLVVVKKPDGA